MYYIYIDDNGLPELTSVMDKRRIPLIKTPVKREAEAKLNDFLQYLFTTKERGEQIC